MDMEIHKKEKIQLQQVIEELIQEKINLEVLLDISEQAVRMIK